MTGVASNKFCLKVELMSNSFIQSIDIQNRSDSMTDAYRANLWLRSAIRVLHKVGCYIPRHRLFCQLGAHVGCRNDIVSKKQSSAPSSKISDPLHPPSCPFSTLPFFATALCPSPHFRVHSKICVALTSTGTHRCA
jgi:hypothetical protein